MTTYGLVYVQFVTIISGEKNMRESRSTTILPMEFFSKYIVFFYEKIRSLSYCYAVLLDSHQEILENTLDILHPMHAHYTLLLEL